jgi:hypothetical protein
MYAVLAVSAAAPPLHPNRRQDTEDNRRIIDFCERYRHAVEARNIPMLLKLADSLLRRWQRGPTDDMDYGLREYLEGQFKHLERSGTMRYHRVSTGRKQTFFVDYTYCQLQILSPSGIWAPSRSGQSPRDHTVRRNLQDP